MVTTIWPIGIAYGRCINHSKLIKCTCRCVHVDKLQLLCDRCYYAFCGELSWPLNSVGVRSLAHTPPLVDMGNNGSHMNTGRAGIDTT